MTAPCPNVRSVGLSGLSQLSPLPSSPSSYASMCSHSDMSDANNHCSQCSIGCSIVCGGLDHYAALSRMRRIAVWCSRTQHDPSVAFFPGSVIVEVCRLYDHIYKVPPCCG